MNLPAPFYKVELIAENGKHTYRVYRTDQEEFIAANRCGRLALPDEYIDYPGVTGVLGIISKPALVPWAKRVTLEKVREELVAARALGDRCFFTEITNPEQGLDAMLARASKRPDQLKDDAAKLGTEAHVYIDDVIKGKPLGPLPTEILEPVSAFADWWKDSGLTFVAGDTKVASRRHAFGGSLDALARKGDGGLVLLDWKTSKAIYDEYALQVAAYAYAFGETYGIQVQSAVCVRFRKPGVDGPPFEALEVKDIPASFEAFLAAKHLQEAMKLDHFNRPPKQEKPNARKSRKRTVAP